jgi:hypothetical protein
MNRRIEFSDKNIYLIKNFNLTPWSKKFINTVRKNLVPTSKKPAEFLLKLSIT